MKIKVLAPDIQPANREAIELLGSAELSRRLKESHTRLYSSFELLAANPRDTELLGTIATCASELQKFTAEEQRREAIFQESELLLSEHLPAPEY